MMRNGEWGMGNSREADGRGDPANGTPGSETPGKSASPSLSQGPSPIPHSPFPEATVLSPCKINLFLDVVGRRGDGYHEVVTVIEPLDLCDRLTFRSTREVIEVTADDPEVPDGEANIVYRAARLLRERAETAGGVSIRIEKHIPSAAGLGGGSADAATALAALNRLWSLNYPLSTLSGLAGELGSDVPFFLSPRTSLWRGRGEKGEFLPPAPPFFAVLINPGFPLSTRRAYGELGISGPARPPHEKLKNLLRALDNSDLPALGRSLYNRFQQELSPRYPPIRELLDFFRRRGALGALLSGSGPTVIGLTAARPEAEELAAAARREFPDNYRVIVASNRPPAGTGTPGELLLLTPRGGLE